MTDKDNLNLRYTFVGMLFALAVAEAAVLCANLYKVFIRDWDYKMSFSAFIDRLGVEDGLMLAPAGHLILGIVLVASSWLGWSKSLAKRTDDSAENIFGSSFWLLMLEVCLLVLYFIFISSVELVPENIQPAKSLREIIPNPSAAPEATLLVVIFLVYALWDVFWDVIPNAIPSEFVPLRRHKKISGVLTFLSGAFTYAFVSLVCAVIAFVIQSKAPLHAEPSSVVWGDFALGVLLYFFRRAKRFELVMFKLFPWEAHRKASHREITNSSQFALELLFLLFVIYLFLSQM